MEKRKLEVTSSPSYIISADGHKIYLRDVPEEPKKRPEEAMDILVKAMAVIGWVAFFISLSIR